MYRFSNESIFIEFSTAFCLNSTLVYPLKYSLRGVKYINKKAADKTNRKTMKEDKTILSDDEDRRFFLSNVFSFTKTM
jgi:hypothetical protein